MSDINIYGSDDFTPDGSIYGSVMIAGAGDIRGNLNCMTLKIMGAGDVSGKVTCEGSVNIAGSGDISEGVECEGLMISGSGDIGKGVVCRGKVTLSGSGDIDGDVKADSVSVSGSSDISGSISAQSVNFGGTASVRGDVSCEKARISGCSEIDGLLNAEEITVELGDIEIEEIGCTTLNVVDSGNRVSAGKKGFGLVINGKTFGIGSNNNGEGHLECRVIEGDDISLVNTSAETVRGRNIRIGEGCDIGRVEYSGELSVDPESEVGTQVKI